MSIKSIEEIRFDDKGLVTTIAQDYETGQILMVAYMNRESLEKTLETGKMTYWSRSRERLWLKGEHSGHFQHVREFRIDCDGDALLFAVTQEGGACHTGYRSCFYRRWDGKRWCVDGEKVFEPNEVY
jgi:phosphoribosyl-AMP cyclohydrolase